MTEARATPLVSVVVPIHNVAPYLRQCLASLRTQTYENLDIICVDDGSTDASGVIAKEVADEDDRITLLTTEAGGPGRARNLGLDLARGDYLAFLDSDDTMPAYAIERLMDSTLTTGSQIVSGRVVRFSGIHAWPSGLHERAIPGPKSRTHITRSGSLLYDTTVWNKIYSAKLWRDHGLRFPEGMLYEDIEVALEAHLRATTVDLISDVVYHWRQRDDADQSITQQRLQPTNLTDRMKSLNAVRTVLAELGPPRLRNAVARKHLVNDIKLYLRGLLRADRAYQELFVDLVRDYLTDVPESVMRGLPPQMAVEYHLVKAGQVDQLLALLQHEEGLNWALPARRRGLSMHLDVGPVTADVASSITRVRRKLPMRVGVDSVTGANGQVVVEGYAFIDHVPVSTPVSQVRRLRLKDDAGRNLTVWLSPRRHDNATVRHGRPRTNYTWAGFRAEIPVAKLAPRVDKETATWTVVVQAFSPLAAKGSTLGPPAAGSAWFPRAMRMPDGLICTSSWGQDQRLRLTVRRSPGSILAFTPAAGQLRLDIRLDTVAARQAHSLLIRPDGYKGFEVALDRTDGPDGERATAEIDVTELTPFRNEAPFTVFQVLLITPDGELRLDTDLDHEVVVHADAEDTVLVRPNSAARAEIVVTPPRVAVTDARWDGERLVIGGMITVVDAEESWEGAGLEFRNGHGERLNGIEHRTENRFETVFEPFAMPGPHGPRALGSGAWDLYRHDPHTGQTARAFVARGSAVGIEAARHDDPVSVRLWVDRHSLLSLNAYALPPHERGSYAQTQLRRSLYRRARSTPLRDSVLFESWQGKQFSDNPRAMLDEALRRQDPRELLVSVTDQSVVVPAGARPVIRWSREYYEALATAGTVVANDSMTKHFVKREGQRYIQTWHGTPLKRIGFDIETIHFRNKRYLEDFELEVGKWDQLLSPSPYTTQILRQAFRYEGEIVEGGYPRNDLLVRPEAEEVRRRTREWLGLHDEQKVLLWAPTWRDNQFGLGRGYSFPMVLDLERLAGQLGDDHVLLFRGHHLISAAVRQMSGVGDFFRNVSGYPDVRDLYCAADVLVTDYSSTMFDFALTGRPIIHLAWDLANYRDELRGFYLDLEQVAAGPVIATGDQLTETLRDLPAVTAQYADRYAAFRERFGALEDGNSSARAWDRLDGRVATAAGGLTTTAGGRGA